MTPKECSHYDTCNASICPLDADWRKRACVPTDSTCRILLEMGKAGAEARFAERPVSAAALPQARALIAEIEAKARACGEDPVPGGWGMLLTKIKAGWATGSSWDKAKAAGLRLTASREAKTLPDTF